jgi:hypothetical protein
MDPIQARLVYPGSDRAEYERELAAVQAQLDPETFAAAWAAGHAMSLQEAIEYALPTLDGDNLRELERAR